jgi:hypothetical protein
MKLIKNQKGITITEALILLVITVLILVGPIGYVNNIIKLTKCDFKTPYKTEVLRGVGVVVPPIGVVEGYLKLEDK